MHVVLTLPPRFQAEIDHDQSPFINANNRYAKRNNLGSTTMHFPDASMMNKLKNCNVCCIIWKLDPHLCFCLVR